MDLHSEIADPIHVNLITNHIYSNQIRNFIFPMILFKKRTYQEKQPSVEVARKYPDPKHWKYIYMHMLVGTGGHHCS